MSTPLRPLRFGERIAVNLSHIKLGRMCVGLVSELKEIGFDVDRAVVFTASEPGTRMVQLVEAQRVAVWEKLQPGQWCSIETLHASGGLFGL